MSAVGTDCPAITGESDSVRLPLAGSVVTSTAEKLLRSVSMNPKSASLNVWLVSSLIANVLSVPCGARLTLRIFSVIVFSVESLSTPPFSVPPVSCIRNLKFALV